MKLSRKPYGTYKYSPTLGVRADFKMLMNRFLAANTVRYEKFSEVWRELKMSYLCACRGSDRECREFIELCFVIALEYLLPPYQFQVRVGGLYLVYALFGIQPVLPKVKIRLTQTQWQETLDLQQQASLQSHLDVVYIFNRLLAEHAFFFCFVTEEMSMSRSAVDSQDDLGVGLADELKEERSCIQSLFNYESMEQLSYLQDQYKQMKIGISGPEARKPNKSLDVAKEGLVEDVVKMLQDYRKNISNLSRSGLQNFDARGNSNEDDEERKETTGTRRVAIKEKAFSQAKTQKHRKTHKVIIEESAGSTSEKEIEPKLEPKIEPDHSSHPDVEIDHAIDDDLPLSMLKKKSNKNLSMPVMSNKNLSMPVIVEEDLSSGDDPEDEDYKPQIRSPHKAKDKGGPKLGYKMKNKSCVRNRIPVKKKGNRNKDSENRPKQKVKSGRPRKNKSSDPSPEMLKNFKKSNKGKNSSSSDICEVESDNEAAPSKGLKVRFPGLSRGSSPKPVKKPAKKYSKYSLETQLDDSEDGFGSSDNEDSSVKKMSFGETVSSVAKMKDQFKNSMKKKAKLNLATLPLPQTTQIIVKGDLGRGPIDLRSIMNAAKTSELSGDKKRPVVKIMAPKPKVPNKRHIINPHKVDPGPDTAQLENSDGFDLLFQDHDAHFLELHEDGRSAETQRLKSMLDVEDNAKSDQALVMRPVSRGGRQHLRLEPVNKSDIEYYAEFQKAEANALKRLADRKLNSESDVLKKIKLEIKKDIGVENKHSQQAVTLKQCIIANPDNMRKENEKRKSVTSFPKGLSGVKYI